MPEFIVNSRIRRLNRTVSDIQSAFPESQIHLTKYPGHASELASSLSTKEIIAVGGDGTVNEVVNGIFSSDMQDKPALGILPKGTANDFAEAQKLKDDLASLEQNLRNESTQSIDVGRVQHAGGTRYFLNVADLGFGAEVVKILRKKSSLFPGLSYLLAITKTFLKYNAIPMVLKENETILWKGDAYGIFIANSSQLASGIKIAPDAQINDGLFNVVVVGDVNGLEYLQIVSRLKKGQPHNSEKLFEFQLSELNAACEVDCSSEADGEFMGDLPVEVSILPSALKLISS